MAIRTALFVIPTALFLIPAAVVAQVPSATPPAGAEEALRGRVNEFFQYFVDGKFRQAINLVAEDTQDAYFSSAKAEIKTFKIDAVTFSKDFTKANVHLTVKQIWKLKAEGFIQDEAVDAPMATTWKVEDGKWVFYQGPPEPDSWVTPMGPSAGFQKPNGATAIPKKLDDATIASEAERILHPASSVDKEQVALATDKPSSAKVIFHNGAPGSVSISMVGLPNALAGFSAKLDKQDVAAGQDAILEIQYDPTESHQKPPDKLLIAVEVAPFSQQYPVQISFGASKQ